MSWRTTVTASAGQRIESHTDLVTLWINLSLVASSLPGHISILTIGIIKNLLMGDYTTKPRLLFDGNYNVRILKAIKGGVNICLKRR
jgi:hypothetical protein